MRYYKQPIKDNVINRQTKLNRAHTPPFIYCSVLFSYYYPFRLLINPTEQTNTISVSQILTVCIFIAHWLTPPCFFLSPLLLCWISSSRTSGNNVIYRGQPKMLLAPCLMWSFFIHAVLVHPFDNGLLQSLRLSQYCWRYASSLWKNHADNSTILIKSSYHQNCFAFSRNYFNFEGQQAFGRLSNWTNNSCFNRFYFTYSFSAANCPFMYVHNFKIDKIFNNYKIGRIANTQQHSAYIEVQVIRAALKDLNTSMLAQLNPFIVD